MTAKRLAVLVFLGVILGAPSCVPPPPPQYAEEQAAPNEPLYTDDHVLEIASYIQDISIRAISEAIARQYRGIPDYGPLSFTTYLGMKLTYRVTAEKQMDHHVITIVSTEHPMSDDAALNLLRYVSDLLGVEVAEAQSNDAGEYTLEFDLDREGQTAFLENLQTSFSEEDALSIWKHAVLDQLSEPIGLIAPEGGGRK
jgi:hypothetical protein